MYFVVFNPALTSTMYYFNLEYTYRFFLFYIKTYILDIFIIHVTFLGLWLFGHVNCFCINLRITRPHQFPGRIF
jgi:hypothetical protein